jgi:hypothetical protein
VEGSVSEQRGTPAVRSSWLVLGVLSAAVLGIVAWLILSAVITSGDVRDARTVFCLQPDQRAALADAAVALGVAEDGSSADGVLVDDVRIDLVQWRLAREDDFNRTCAALSAVRNVPATVGSQAATIVVSVVLAVLTSALAFVSTYWRDRMIRSQTDGDALRTSVKAYDEAANAYLDGFVSFPSTASPAAMDAARGELAGRLHGVRRGYPAWRAVGDVLEWLDNGELRSAGRELDQTKDTTSRIARIEELKAQVTRVVEIGNLAANALIDPTKKDSALELPLNGMSGQ